MSDDAVLLIMMAMGFLIVSIVYMLPAILAFRWGHLNRWLILVINVAFGGTVIGWGIALVWAMRAVHRPGSTSTGGEFGLNLFINDVKKIQVVDPSPLPSISPAQELERLHDLLVRGVISQAEFDGLEIQAAGRRPITLRRSSLVDA